MRKKKRIETYIREVAMVAERERESARQRREKREGEDRGVKYWEDLRGSSNLFPGCMQGSSEVL